MTDTNIANLSSSCSQKEANMQHPDEKTCQPPRYSCGFTKVGAMTAYTIRILSKSYCNTKEKSDMCKMQAFRKWALVNLTSLH